MIYYKPNAIFILFCQISAIISLFRIFNGGHFWVDNYGNC